MSASSTRPLLLSGFICFFITLGLGNPEQATPSQVVEFTASPAPDTADTGSTNPERPLAPETYAPEENPLNRPGATRIAAEDTGAVDFRPSQALYLHPFITLLLASVPEAPLAFVLTYERNHSPFNSFIAQPTLVLLNSVQSENFEVNGVTAGAYLGLRRYLRNFKDGFYLQGSAPFLFSAIDVKENTGSFSPEDDEASGLIFTTGLLGSLGYKISAPTGFVLDLNAGAGFAFGVGSAESESGEEVQATAQGLLLEINIGLGYAF